MYRKNTHGLSKHYDFAILDLLCLQLAYVIAYLIFRSGSDYNPYSLQIYRVFAILIELVSMAVLFSNHTLKNVLKRGYYLEFLVTVRHVFYSFIVSVFLLYLVHSAEQYSRLIFGFTFAFYGILTYCTRIFWKYRLNHLKKDTGDRSLLLVTDKNSAETVITNIKEHNYGKYHLAGAVLLDADETFVDSKIADVSIVSNTDNLVDYVIKNWVDEILILTDERDSLPEQLLEELTETGVILHIGLSTTQSISGRKQIIEKVADYTVLTTSMYYASWSELFVKRLIDIVGGLIGCIATGILFLFLAPAIYIQSPGPIFFVQTRVGKNGKPFKLYKFRSMYMDAEERKAELMDQNKSKDGRMFKMDFDPRVIGNRILPDGTRKTGIGQFIRNYSLDEFPQFWCVLIGTMSIVGTRPPLPGEVNLYEHHHRARLAVKPGITGLWQVSGRSDITDFEEVVKLDREYIDNWYLGMDLRIILKTVQVVLKKKGSI